MLKKRLPYVVIVFAFFMSACGNGVTSQPSYGNSDNSISPTTESQAEYGSTELPCEDTEPYVGKIVTCVARIGQYSCGSDSSGIISCSVPEFANYQYFLLIDGTNYADYNGKCLIVKGLVDYTYMGETNKQVLEINAGSDYSFCQ
jgi:hypothetical protein